MNTEASSSGSRSLVDKCIRWYHDYSRKASERWDALPTRAKVVIAGFAIFQGLVGIGIIYLGPERIFAALADYAKDLREMPLGWLVIIAGIICSSVPPVVSFYGMLITICGFAYESVFHGWLVGTAGCLAGSVFSFTVCRLFMSKFRPLLETSPHFKAITEVIDEKGLPLIVLVRFAPISFGYSNLLFASIHSVTLLQFILATLAITPKLLLHVFIGNRMYQLADPEERHKLDATGKVLNGLSIAFGVAVGSGVGIYVWRLMMKYVNAVELRDEHLEQGLLSGRTSSEHARHSFDYQRTLSMDRRNQDVDAEEMSLDEIDRELRAQGVDHRATTADETHPGSPSAGWGDHFSDFEDQEDEPLPKDPQATQDVARMWDESQPAKKGQDSSLL